VTVLKAPATRQDVEVRIGRDCFINVPIKNTDGSPYLFLADKTVVWRFGLHKSTPLLTRRSDDAQNPVLILADESRVLVPIRAADTTVPTRMIPSSPSMVYFHEVEVLDTAGKGVNVTEGKLILIEAFT
jgi:hypothetical protein